jgi:hypothetical protein
MKHSVIAASLGLAGMASAVSTLPKYRRDSSTNSTCVQQSDAEDIVTKFISVMEHQDVNAANQTVQALLTDDFSETSDSINTLAGDTVSPSFER